MRDLSLVAQITGIAIIGLVTCVIIFAYITDYRNENKRKKYGKSK